MRQTKESLQEQERGAAEEKKALFQFLLRIVSDLEAELDDAAGKRRDTAAAGKGLFPDVTEEVVKEVMEEPEVPVVPEVIEPVNEVVEEDAWILHPASWERKNEDMW